MTITIQDIDDIIILSIHKMIEKVPERVKASAHTVKNFNPFSGFFNHWFLC